ncbi:hypothetical protein [Amycolatopsis rubida]|uniref:hypothetical protein n=1 Tax=Amycolatopsis rubida TaxID=112413 RepID=UPI001160AAEA|nr:hypothetical protein [Amycolatopsis rubida]
MLARERRDEQIAEANAEGSLPGMIAAKFGLSRTAVDGILKTQEADPTREIRSAGTAHPIAALPIVSPRVAVRRSPTSDEIDARIKACRGRWPQVSGDRDELTVLARARRDQQITQMGANGKSTLEICDRFGLSAQTARRIISTWTPIAVGLPIDTTLGEPSGETRPTERATATASLSAVSSRVAEEDQDSPGHGCSGVDPRGAAYAAD